MIKKATLTICLITSSLLISCKESELDTIKDAQICLNKAAPSEAQACVASLDSSEQSSQLKCAAYFIQEGFGTPTALIDAIEATDSSCPTCSGSMGIISQLAFPSGLATADAAFNVCNSSGVAVYSQLSSLVQIATITKDAGACSTSAECATTLAASVSDATLGQIVLQTYASSCSGSSSNDSASALSQYCSELAQVSSGLTDAQAGACLKEQLTGVNDVDCPLF